MLDLRAITQRLTQGQPAAERVVAQRDRGGGEAGATAGSQAGESASAGPAAPAAAPGVDPQALAQRVYELMCQELAVERDRRGLRR